MFTAPAISGRSIRHLGHRVSAVPALVTIYLCAVPVFLSAQTPAWQPSGSLSSPAMLQVGDRAGGFNIESPGVSQPWAGTGGVFSNVEAVDSNFAYGNLEFYTFGNATGWTEKMRITGNGNVGIGTTNPQQLLDVALGKNGNTFRNYYAGVIGLQATDFETLHGIALSCRAQVKTQDDAALVVIKAARAKVAQARANGAPLPPPPPELKAMQQQRNALVNGCIAQLQQTMTSAGFLALGQFLHQQLAKHVQVKPPAALIRKGQNQESQNQGATALAH